jgi:hypothetical protein
MPTVIRDALSILGFAIGLLGFIFGFYDYFCRCPCSGE